MKKILSRFNTPAFYCLLVIAVVISFSGSVLLTIPAAFGYGGGGGILIITPPPVVTPPVVTPPPEITPPVPAPPVPAPPVPTPVQQARLDQITQIVSEAVKVYTGDIDAVLAEVKAVRDISAETSAEDKYVAPLVADVSAPTLSVRSAMTHFVTYGTKTTLKLGKGERAGVVNSFKSAFGKVPQTETDWQDVFKIANGRWPSQRAASKEDKATAAFKKIYLREPDRSDPHDDAAVVVMAYGLRPSDRNLDSEKAAIRIFKGIYGYNPSNAVDWDAMRAIAYSGSTR